MVEYKFRATPMFRRRLNTQTVMAHLLLGLIVVYLFGLYNSYVLGTEYFIHALLMLLCALLGGVGTEVVYALALKKDVKQFLSTSFPWITCLILVEIIPCDTSLYAVFVSSILAIFFGKLVFGGFGQNTFNPAAVGRCFITTSFVSTAAVDLITQSTPTSSFASSSWLMTKEGFEAFLSQYGGLSNLFLGNYFGALGETSTLIILVLLIIFLADGVVDWRVPLTYITVCFVSSFIIGEVNGLGIRYAIAFICTGGLLYGAVFMLTDPVTSPFSVPGRMVFACVAALVTCFIRFLGNLPEGVCYGILIANMLSPLIDKIFSCKQIDAYKKNSIITYATIVLTIIAITLAGLSITPTEYKYADSNNTAYVEVNHE